MVDTHHKEAPRLIMVSGRVNDEMNKEVVQKILEWNIEDDERESMDKKFVRTANPIRMIVNTPGGSVDAGFGIVSAMQGSETPIVTVCLGTAMSMGFLIFAAGDKRVAHKLSTFMYHEISNVLWGKLTEFKAEATWMQTCMDMYDSVILERTNITKERLDEVKKNKIEWYMTSDDALKYGLVDELY